MHNIKGNAALLSLEYFQKTCDAFEQKIVELRNRPALGGDDFLSIVIAESDLRADLAELQDLREKLTGIQRVYSGPVAAAPAFGNAVAAPATTSSMRCARSRTRSRSSWARTCACRPRVRHAPARA